MRRSLVIVVAFTSIASTLVARAEPEAVPLLPDGVYARPGYASLVPPPGSLLAGAASGDITPPFGVAATGFYADRHCAASTALSPFTRTDEIRRDIEGDPTEAPYAVAPCTAAKLGPDTDVYARTHPPSTGRSGRLRANAHVLSDGRTTVALVSVDLPGFFGEMHQAVANRIEHLGIARSHLLVSASHTHTGPAGYFGQGLGWAAASGDTYDPRVFDAITSGITDAITRAHAALRPAKLASGTALVPNVTWNRRTRAWALNPEAIGGVDEATAPRLGMIRIDGTDGRPIGVITNFSTHGTIGSATNEWLTGDDKGWVSRLVEGGIGGDAVVTSLNGAQGDIGGATSDTGGWSSDANDWGGRTGLLGEPHAFGQFARMEDAGNRQASHQLALWHALEDDLSSEVSLDARLDLVCFCGQEIEDDPYDPYDRGAWEPTNDDPAYRRVSTLAILGVDGQQAPRAVVPGQHRKVPLVVAPPPVVAGTLRVQVLRVGDVAFTTMPGEPTITMGRRIERSVKAALNGDTPDALVEHVWTTSLANDHASYFTTIQEYESYLYESTATMFGQQTGNAFKRRLVDLAEQMALGGATPPCEAARACMEQPDTSAAATRPEPLSPDVSAGVVLRQPADVERFEGTQVTWIGGGPGAEYAPGETLVTLERLEGGDWQTVATDLHQTIPVRYGKRYGEHRYTAYIDPVANAPTGTHRIRITGYAATGPLTRAPYTIVSRTFTVSPSTRLTAVARGDGRVDLQHPTPDPWSNFRWRARHAAAAVAHATVDGVAMSFAGSITLSPGALLEIPAGGITDAYGNSNGAAITITG